MRDCALQMLVGLMVAGCASSAVMPDGSTLGPGDGGPGYTPGSPGVGAHAINFYHLGSSVHPSPLSVGPMATQHAGSTIVVGVGRGDNSQFALPTDSMANSPYRQLGAMHAYTHWPSSGTSLYAVSSAKGASDFRVSTTTDDHDEITLVAVEVIEGTKIQASEWIEVTQDDGPVDVTSKSVTTTGPATLIAFWWGDGFPGYPQSASANNGFLPVETNASERDSFVQVAVAAKNVAAAGTYDVTWTSNPVQGAQLWLIAVQQ